MPSEDVSADVEAAYSLLKVEEAGRLMRVGRSKAYALAHEYLSSGGTAGPAAITDTGTAAITVWPDSRFDDPSDGFIEYRSLFAQRVLSHPERAGHSAIPRRAAIPSR